MCYWDDRTFCFFKRIRSKVKNEATNREIDMCALGFCSKNLTVALPINGKNVHWA